MNLFEIDKRYTEAFVNTVNPETGEVIGEQLDVDYLEQLGVARHEKVENIGLYVKNLKAESEAIGNEIKTMQDRKRRKDNRIKSLKKYLVKYGGNESVETAQISIKFYPGRDSVMIDRPEEIPEPYKVYTYTPDKKALKEALQEGRKIPGVHLEKNPYVSIK